MKENRLPNNDEKAYRIAYLIAGYIRKTLSEAEHNELDAWVEQSDENMQLFEELTDEKNIEANLAWMEGLETEKALEKTKKQLQFTRPVKTKTKNLWVFMAAAVVLLAIVAIYLVYPKKKEVMTIDAVAKNDALPGGNRATLRFSDGRVVNLEAKSNGIIENGNGTKIEKKEEGLLSYQKLSTSKEMKTNTLSVPRGGRYALSLSDGTKVWLNALSTLEFPEQFLDPERVVTLNGEAYFEVAKDKQHPFVVKIADKEEVRVLGTKFTISSYPDEETKKVTLVEGSVNVKRETASLQLTPGQAASITRGNLELEKHADIEAATGWKNDLFIFRDADIYKIMRQAERWYDVNVIYRTTTSEHFNFSVSRTEPLSKILHLMELTGKIHFKIENKNVYVLQ